MNLKNEFYKALLGIFSGLVVCTFLFFIETPLETALIIGCIVFSLITIRLDLKEIIEKKWIKNLKKKSNQY